MTNTGPERLHDAHAGLSDAAPPDDDGCSDYPSSKGTIYRGDSERANRTTPTKSCRTERDQFPLRRKTCERRTPGPPSRRQRWPSKGSHSPPPSYTYPSHRTSSPESPSHTSYSGSPAYNCSRRDQLYPLCSRPEHPPDTQLASTARACTD